MSKAFRFSLDDSLFAHLFHLRAKLHFTFHKI
jgi:hypothetical protein